MGSQNRVNTHEMLRVFTSTTINPFNPKYFYTVHCVGLSIFRILRVIELYVLQLYSANEWHLELITIVHKGDKSKKTMETMYFVDNFVDMW